jgi:hypothetical protein
MAPTFHDYALSPLLRSLRNILLILRKAEAHAAANSVDPTDYTTARLYPDMHDLCYQVYSLTNTAAEIASAINPSNPTLTQPHDETTLPALIARVEKALAFAETIDPSSLAGRETEPVVITVAGGAQARYATAVDYVTRHAHPNFWFHTTVMYSLLRMKGVPVGKIDFLNGTGDMEFKMPGGDWTTDVSQIKPPTTTTTTTTPTEQ